MTTILKKLKQPMTYRRFVFDIIINTFKILLWIISYTSCVRKAVCNGPLAHGKRNFKRLRKSNGLEYCKANFLKKTSLRDQQILAIRQLSLKAGILTFLIVFMLIQQVKWGQIKNPLSDKHLLKGPRFTHSITI